MEKNKEQQLLNELSTLLEKQIDLIRHDNITGLEELADLTEQLTLKIKEAGLLDKSEYEQQKNYLSKLYQELNLLLSTQKEATAMHLKLINKGIKTLTMYKGGI